MKKLSNTFNQKSQQELSYELFAELKRLPIDTQKILHLIENTDVAHLNGNQKCPFGYTALHWAVDQKQIEIVRALIDKGMNINEQDRDGSTSLQLAASLGHKDILCLLLDKGASADTADNYGAGALDKAIEGVNMALDTVEKKEYEEIVTLIREAPKRRVKALLQAKKDREDALRNAVFLKEDLILPPPQKLRKNPADGTSGPRTKDP